jgi:hypothetical protein
VRAITGGAHDRDDFLHARRIGRVAQTLVAWCVAGVKIPASSPAIDVDRRDRATAQT